MATQEPVSYEVRDRVAIITLNRPRQLGAMDQAMYFRIATYLRQAARDENTVVTLLVGKGRFFSAGADVRARKDPEPHEDVRKHISQNFGANNLEITQAFFSHPKILVVGLNGPVVGLSAALSAHADFIYAAPHTYLLVPFTSLGLISEGSAAHALVQRMGIAKANEALLMSKRIPCNELVQCGFVNQIIQAEPSEDDKFLNAVLHEIHERLGPHLNKSSMFEIKRQIRTVSRRQQSELLVDEIINGVDRFTKGIPQAEFAKIASGAKRHKL